MQALARLRLAERREAHLYALARGRIAVNLVPRPLGRSRNSRSRRRKHIVVLKRRVLLLSLSCVLIGRTVGRERTTECWALSLLDGPVKDERMRGAFRKHASCKQLRLALSSEMETLLNTESGSGV